MAHKTKATGGGRQWENTKHKPEHHSDLLAGGQCVRFAPMTLGLTEGHYGECAGLLVGYSCSFDLVFFSHEATNPFHFSLGLGDFFFQNTQNC